MRAILRRLMAPALLLTLLPAAAGGDAGREKDVQTIRVMAGAVAQAFNKHDAEALAAFWTENGEHEDETGLVLQGRPALAKAFAEFFKNNPDAKMEILIETIRFPAKDLAIEEGLLRMSGAAHDLPTTARYAATHVREGGEWRTARVREAGAGRHRLEDLEWLVGKWEGGGKDRSVTLTFAKAANQPFLTGTFVRKEKGKTVFSGTLKIGIDPVRGQLRSWHFDDDGGHGQALWLRDGNRWVLDSIGVLGDGSEMECLNILGRVDGDTFTWRTIDRVVDEEALPDTAPVRLSRVRTR